MFKKIREKIEANRVRREKEERKENALQAQILADKAIYMTEIEESFRDGSLAMGQPSIILKRNEVWIMDLSASLWEGRAVRTGGYAGTRVRIAKGVSVNVGGFKAESHQELREIDSGTFTLTNQRIVFSGGKRTLSINLNKIITVAPYLDRTIALSREGKQKTQYFQLPEGEIPVNVEERTYSEPISGQMIVWAIEGALERSND